jgi:spoIIIJ-associated protein
MTDTHTPQHNEQEVHDVTAALLLKMGVGGTIEVSAETADHYNITIHTEESGLLIGRHGETLNSLQLLLGVIFFKKLGTWIHVILDVGDYRKAREENIKDMVNRIISEVEASGQAVTLPFLTPLERRQVHLMLTDHETVVSESIGEGKDRRLTIHPKS